MYKANAAAFGAEPSSMQVNNKTVEQDVKADPRDGAKIVQRRQAKEIVI